MQKQWKIGRRPEFAAQMPLIRPVQLDKQQDMAHFDFIESASRGYRFIWEERESIFRIAAIPVAIKVATFLGVTALDLGNGLRQGLLMLPAYFAEGWLMAQVIRFAILGERWPVVLSGDPKKDEEIIMGRSRGILSGMIVYVLIKMVLAFVAGYVSMATSDGPGGSGGAAAPAPEPTLGMFFVATFLLAGLIWTFRLLWLYVPAALDYPMADFLRRAKPFMTSVYMVGAWLLCFIPMAMVMSLISQMLHSAFPSQGDFIPAGYIYSVTVVQAIVEVIVTIIASVAMAHIIQSLYKGTKTDGYF